MNVQILMHSPMNNTLYRMLHELWILLYEMIS
jgi:hypothetical protein